MRIGASLWYLPAPWRGELLQLPPGLGWAGPRGGAACTQGAGQGDRDERTYQAVAAQHRDSLPHDLKTTVAISQMVAAPVETLGAGVAPCPTTLSSTNSSMAPAGDTLTGRCSQGRPLACRRSRNRRRSRRTARWGLPIPVWSRSLRHGRWR